LTEKVFACPYVTHDEYELNKGDPACSIAYCESFSFGGGCRYLLTCDAYKKAKMEEELDEEA